MKHTKIYAEVLEESALDQFESAMDQYFVVAGALMPDAHKGYSLPIGAVIETNNFILPSWVGYDIGCGMCAMKLDGISKDDVDQVSEDIFNDIYKVIPVGFNTNAKGIEYYTDGLTDKGIEIAEHKNYQCALGSLGGGNHFIEIGYDEDETVWIIIHSGSRGVGHGIATHYMTLASSDTKVLEKEFDDHNEDTLKYNPDNYDRLKASYIKKRTGKLRPKDGHYGFNAMSENGIEYIKDLNWCLDYALANRLEMMERIVNVVTDCLDLSCYELDFSNVINKNHNHAVKNKVGNWVHRKGATQAEDGMLGVIPGNMLDGSFIVKGKGNSDSLCSSSHGAGRVLSRRKAKEQLNVKDFENIMEGITAKVDDSTLDESPFAYKNIFEVMKLQEDLVDIIHHIKPLINIKG